MLKNFLSNIGGLFKSGEPKNVRRWLYPEAEQEYWQMPDPARAENQFKLYQTLSYLATVADVVASACIDADFDVIGADGKEIDEHPFNRLLDNPNNQDSRTEFLSAHFHYRIIAGNSFWYLSRSSESAPPDEIWILSPSRVKPVPDGRMGLRGYVYYPGNGQEIPLEPYEVAHFKSWNPYSRYIGLSAVESIAMTSAGALAAQTWNTKLFAENNARLPGFLAFAEMVNDGDWERMKREISDSAKKRNYMMLRGVGKGGVEWMQAASTQKEMEFLAGLDRSMRDIYDRLAPGLYNMLTSNASLANGQTGMAAFARFTLAPLLRETADKITCDILTAYGDNIRAEYENVIPEDEQLRLAQIAEAAKYHTVNEIRDEFYKKEPLTDERGSLLVSQITPPAAQETAPALMEQPAALALPEVEYPILKAQVVNQSVPFETPDPLKADLDRWRRKAIKNIGKPAALVFTSDHIPPELHAVIVEGVKSAQTADEVARVFAEAKVPAGDEAIVELARAINRAVSVVTMDAPKYEQS